MEMLSKEADLKMLQMTDLPDKQPIDAQEIEHNCSQSKYHISCTDERCKQHGEKSFWKISWTNYDKLIVRENNLIFSILQFTLN